MREEVKRSEQVTGSLEILPGICFDPDEAVLEGTYLDEISAYRAKRVWTETLETNFLLETNHDFYFRVISSPDKNCFVLKCDFSSACGRYAFWRLTRNQAPEAQYLIETAHIPQTESRHEEFLSAPDMSPVRYVPLLLDKPRKSKNAIKAVLRKILRRVLTSR